MKIIHFDNLCIKNEHVFNAGVFYGGRPIRKQLDDSSFMTHKNESFQGPCSLPGKNLHVR